MHQQLADHMWYIITPEYPPTRGGVSDYAKLLATAFAGAGDHVHVWYPRTGDIDSMVPGVCLHPQVGGLTPFNLREIDRHLDRVAGPRRLLVQWVPHGYGYRSMNLPFCLWLWSRSRLHGDEVEIMVHEAFLAFGEGTWRQNIVASVHRLMTIILLRAARKVWVAIPAWERCWKPYRLGKKVVFEWLPVPSSIPVVRDLPAISAIRQRYVPNGEILLGSFSTFCPLTRRLLRPLLSAMFDSPSKKSVLLIGKGSEEFRQELIKGSPSYGQHLHATGALPPEDLSRHISACDILIQPYPDGVSSRRSSLMAGLSHGKPIVTTAGPLTEPLWAESGAVALAEVGDIRMFVQLQEKLCVNSDERSRLGKSAQELYLKCFDIRHTLAALYRSNTTAVHYPCVS